MDLPVPEEEEPPQTYADGSVILEEDVEVEEEEEEIVIEEIIIEIEEQPVSKGVEKIEEKRPEGKEVVSETVFRDAWVQFAKDVEKKKRANAKIAATESRFKEDGAVVIKKPPKPVEAKIP